MMEYVRMVIANCVMFGGAWIAGDILFEEKSKKVLKSVINIILGSILISIFNMEKIASLAGYTKILLVFLVLTFFLKNRYEVKTSKALIGSIIVYANTLVADMFLVISISAINQIFSVELTTIFKYSLLSALLSILLSILILRIFNKKYIEIFKKAQINDTKLVTIIMIVFIVFTIISGIIPLKDLKVGIEMLLVAILMIGFIVIGAYIFLENIEKNNRLKEYERLSDYAKANENLLEDYRIRCHESSNHLIIIDHMIPKNNKKAHEYINSLLCEHKINKYYFINELKNIPITELKGFINYKLMIMVNENIHLQINISPEVKSSKLKTLSRKDRTDLYNIVGVLLDNAYDASKESKEKEVAFTMYKEGTTVVLMVANTHKDEIDINRISEYGYSTKGKNHGTGLYIVDKIIDKNPKFTKETSTFENYFIQTIRIK